MHNDLLYIHSKHRVRKFIIFLSGVLFLTGCSSDDDKLISLDPVSYTTLIYLAADNSLDNDVDYTISKIKEGAKKSAGTAIVYLDRNYSKSTEMEQKQS